MPVSRFKTHATPAPQSLAEMLQQISARASACEDANGLIRIAEILKAVGRRAFGPILLLLGLFSLSPLAMLPGANWLAAAGVLLVAGQIVLGAPYPWLPRLVLDARLSAPGVRQACEALQGWAKRIDAFLKARLTPLARPPLVNLAGLACMMAALSVYPLGLLPLAPFAPSLAITLIGLGLFVKDGIMILAGSALVAGAFLLAARILG